ncbi:hypothetical protein HOB10_03750 [Candidatus Parcubacteria bacterium]|jgi:hypothetical protein|nr:hypothetical protein [Candidatus Parcubacteria bacterium]
MSLATLTLVFVFAVNIILLFLILLSKNKQRRWPIFTMVLLLAFWQSIELLDVTIFIDKGILLLQAERFGLLPILFLAPAWMWLVFSLFDKWAEIKIYKKFLYYLPGIAMIPFVFTDYNLKDVVVNNGLISYTPGALYYFFSIYFVGLVGYGLYVLIRHRNESDLVVKKQIDYIFTATALTVIASVLFSVILPLVGVSDFYYIGVNSSVLFTLIVTYALFRHRFFNVKIFFYRIVINLLRLFIVGFVFHIFYMILSQVVGISFSDSKSIIFFLIFLGVTAPFLFDLVNKLVTSFLINPSDDVKNAENSIADILRSSQDMNLLYSKLVKEISKVVDYQEIFIYLSKKDSPNSFYQVFPVGERLINVKDSHMLEFLQRYHKAANQAEIGYFKTDKKLAKEMKDKQIDIALPIFYNQQLLGVMIIDNGDQLLSTQQLHFLHKVNKYLDIAVGSLLLHQQAMSDKCR